MATIKPSWIATLRHIAHLNDTDVRVNDRDVDLRIVRALDRRRLVRDTSLGWVVTDAALELLDADFRPTPDQTGLDEAHALAEILDDMDVTTDRCYRALTPDTLDKIHARAAMIVAGTWVPCVRNNADHIGHDEAQGEDCLTPAYGYDGMGGWVHTDGNTYLHDPATSAYKPFADMEEGDVIAYAGRPEIEIIAGNATEAKDSIGRYFPAHIGRDRDTGEYVTVPFGYNGSAPVKLRPGKTIAAPPPPEFARPGNLSYEIDNGQHRWRLEGSGGMTADIDPTAPAKAKAWAADLIYAGAVDGLKEGSEVARWEHHSCDGAEWLVPVLADPDPDSDRDSDSDRDRTAKVTPRTVSTRIGVGQSRSAHRPRTETMSGARTETSRSETRTRTGREADRDRPAVRYLVETRTAGGWSEVQAGSLVSAFPEPDQKYLDCVADTIRGNVGFVLGRGASAPDVPVRITTWADGIHALGHILIDPQPRH